MPRLVLINGLPGSGKSTLARRFAADRALTLVLDVDVVRGQLGASLSHPGEAGRRARELALSMAATRLRSGHDVVVPQFLGRSDFAAALDAVAAGANATFVEVALVLEPEVAARRFTARSLLGVRAEERDAAVLLARQGGVDQFSALQAQLDAALAERPGTRRLPADGDAEVTYRALVALVDASDDQEVALAGKSRTSGRDVASVDDLLRMLDGVFDADDRWTDRGGPWWNGFYADREREVPFFRDVPDESLVAWHEAGVLAPRPGARALDLGCGPGRNAIWLARQGYEVDAVDLSPTAIAWGQERAAGADVDVRFVTGDLFRQDMPMSGYELVYDSGCFHRLPPHRRISYTALIEAALAPGGAFGLACFARGSMGSELPDAEFYRERRLFGGLAYSQDDLRRIFGWLQEVELRRMHDRGEHSQTFGESFLWAALFRR